MTRLKINPNLICREDEDKILLFNPLEGRLFMLQQDTAIFVWKSCEGKTVEELAEEYIQKFNGTKNNDDLKKDALTFIQGLKDAKLLQEE